MGANILVKQPFSAGVARRRIAVLAMTQFCATFAVCAITAVTLYKIAAAIARKLLADLTVPDQIVDATVHPSHNVFS